jgi:hypothetical protein
MLIPLGSTIGAKEGRVNDKSSMNSIELVYLTKHMVLNVTDKLGVNPISFFFFLFFSFFISLPPHLFRA